ncbi:MAG: NAD-binding protein [Acidimicrobiales bacterium]
MNLRESLARMAASLRPYRWFLLAFLALVAFALGLFVPDSIDATGASISPDLDGRAYRSIQLFLLNGGNEDHPGTLFRIARFLAPAVAAWAALAAFAALFRDQIDAVRLHFTRGHVIVCGAGEKGTRLARALLPRHRVAVIERDGASARVRALRAAQIPVVVGDATDPEVLRAAGVRRARHLVTVCGADAVDASIAAAAGREAAAAGHSLTVLAHVSDANLAQALATAAIGDGVRYEYFSLDDRGAAAILDAHPLPIPADRTARVGVVGLTGAGERMLVHLGRRRLASGAEPLEVVTNRADDARLDALRARVPLLDATLVFRPEGDPVDITYVCLPGDDACVATALEIAATQDHPVVAVLRSSAGLAELAAATAPARRGQLSLATVLDHVFNGELVEQGLTDVLARALHADYAERVAERRDDQQVVAVGWDDLTEELRESNRRAAVGAFSQLGALGWSVLPLADRAAAEIVLPVDQVETVAQAEHERWRAERTAAGWHLGPRIAGGRASPHLVDWVELPDAIKDENRLAAQRLPGLFLRAGLQLVRRG